jgi:hypothetical protein
MKETLYALNPWWENKEFKIGLPRDKYLSRLIKSLDHQRAVLVTGSRRVGKTTLLRQLINHLISKKKIDPKEILYVLLDHPRLSKSSIIEIIREHRKLHLLNRDKKIYLFFDEVQYIKNWERETKAVVDSENVKVFLSGSASAEIFQKTPALTGRYEKIKINPLDFSEFLKFRNVSISPSEEYKYERYLEDYLVTGGYPEYVLNGESNYFPDLLESIIFKDIVYAHNVRNPDIIRDLLLLLSDRNGHQSSFTKLGKVLGITTDTAKEYVNFIKQTFIVEEIERFSTSRSKKIYSAKKFYFQDCGLLHSISSKFNLGSAAESVLHKFLNEKFPVNFYYEDKKEVDFIFSETNGDIVLVESKFIQRQDEINKKIWLSIAAVANETKAKKIFIITKNLEKTAIFGGKKMNFIPFHKFVIQNYGKNKF